MKTFRTTIATLFAILFILSAVASILLFNFDRRAFDAETYQQAFERASFYNTIPALLAQSITTGTDPTQQPFGLQGIHTETWESFTRTLLPPDVLKVVGDDLLISTFAYLNMESDSIQIDLIPIKTSMMGESGAQAALVLLNSLPPCTLEQSAMIMFGMFSGDQVQLCNPPENVQPMLMPIIEGQMKATAATIPDSLTLATASLQNDPREKLATARLLMRLSLILPITLLLTLTVLTVRSLRDWLNWWGIPFLITGLITFILGLIGAPLLRTVLENTLSAQMPAYLPAFLLDFSGNFAAAMVRALLTPVGIQGIILMVIGVSMAGLGYYISRK